MKLSREEESLLRRWIYDEVHFLEGRGPAKQLQLDHKAIPADLAVLIAASMTEPGEQESAAEGPPAAEPPVWPWTVDSFQHRLAEARTLLHQRQQNQTSVA